jgi:hypothetical protein
MPVVQDAALFAARAYDYPPSSRSNQWRRSARAWLVKTSRPWRAPVEDVVQR